MTRTAHPSHSVQNNVLALTVRNDECGRVTARRTPSRRMLFNRWIPSLSLHKTCRNERIQNNSYEVQAPSKLKRTISTYSLKMGTEPILEASAISYTVDSVQHYISSINSTLCFSFHTSLPLACTESDSETLTTLGVWDHFVYPSQQHNTRKQVNVQPFKLWS